MAPKPVVDPNGRIAFNVAVDGIALEHVIRTAAHNMDVKHFHSEYEIFYILEGKREFFFDNRNFVAEKGDLVLIDSNMIHMTRSTGENDLGHDRIILYITPERMEQIDQTHLHLHLVRFFHEHYGIYHLNEHEHDLLMQLYYQFKRETRERSLLYQLSIELSVSMFLLSLYRNITTKGDTFKKPLVNQHQNVYEIADYLLEHYTNPPTLDELSEQFFLSKYHICRVFKEVTGYNIREFINIHRIRNAKLLLETTNKSITEISESVGYESATHFEKVFKSYMNMSPLQYRKAKDL